MTAEQIYQRHITALKEDKFGVTSKCPIVFNDTRELRTFLVDGGIVPEIFNFATLSLMDVGSIMILYSQYRFPSESEEDKVREMIIQGLRNIHIE
jgi:hypothetical protein